MNPKNRELIASEILEKAYMAGGFRERYAMDYGTPRLVKFGDDACIRFDYSKDNAYQDANGAMYSVNREKWIY